MIKTVLITGGVRSGKSSFAEELAEELNLTYQKSKIAYIATAEITDEEFEQRIKKHQQRRGDEYSTYEVPVNIYEFLVQIQDRHNIFIIECLATWLGNLYYKYPDSVDEILNKELEKLSRIINSNKQDQKTVNNYLQILKNNANNQIPIENLFENSISDKVLIFVSNEVGTGIVPESKMARSYRDDLGYINRRIASNADYVFNCICGIPTRIK